MKKTLAQISEGFTLAKVPEFEIISAEVGIFDYEVIVWWNAGATERVRLVSCLCERFPKAKISKVTS
jgi:hypothetical protein